MKKDKKINPTFKTAEVITLVLITCVVSLFMGFLISESDKQEYKPADREVQDFIKQYNYIVNNYYEEVDKAKLIEAAIEGMVSSLDDPYSIYLDENTSTKFNAELNGSYNGIGVEIVNDVDKNIIVTRVFENSSAAKAGIEPLDIIESINDTKVSNTTTTDFLELVKKITNKEFQLGLKRKDKSIQVTVSRTNVTLNSVSSNIFEKNNKKIGYLYISIFANNTDFQFKTKLNELENKKIDSLIVDLRGNSGGHLLSVENIMSMFLNKDKVIYQIEDKGEKTKHYSEGTETKKYKIVVLIDNNSASASEMLAATLKESYGATLVGKTTYGKGTVQELHDTTSSQYKITTKKWLTPNGTWINGVGINPDVEIELNNAYFENPTNDTDNQLQRALEILGK